jgi:hypothetical protein
VSGSLRRVHMSVKQRFQPVGSIGEAVIARTPLQRPDGDEDLMGAVGGLAGDASRHVTGHAQVVDGGSSIA